MCILFAHLNTKLFENQSYAVCCGPMLSSGPVPMRSAPVPESPTTVPVARNIPLLTHPVTLQVD